MTTIDAKEIAHFAKDSGRWWDEDGPFRPLHRLNPTRLQYIKDRICAHHGRDPKGLKSYTGLSVLDIGCGGGLVCEPTARLGADVTGIDADANAIAAAMAHAKVGGLEIMYRACSTGELLANPALRLRGKSLDGRLYDIVLALEIIEHVADVRAFVDDCAALCKPGGLIVFSTLNRTLKSMLLGKIAAEYLLGWVPKGTHDWKKFIRPSELSRTLREAGLSVTDSAGMVFNPLNGGFALSPDDLAINYFMTATKPA